MNLSSQYFTTFNPISNRFFAILFWVWVLLPAVGVAGQTGITPLTEAETVRLALQRPAVQDLMSAERAIAESGLTAARLWPNPELEFARESVDRAIGENTEDTFWISQRFQISGARGLRKDAAQERIRAAEFKAGADRLAIETDAKQRFHQLLHQYLLVEAIQDWTARMGNLEEIVKKRQEAGEVSGYDTLRLSRERASIDAALKRELARQARLWAEMMALLGEEADAASRFGSISGDLLPPAPPALTSLLGTLNDRPDIAQLERELAALEMEQRASARGWVPELTLGAGQKRIDDDIGRDTGPMVMAGITLPLFNRGQAENQRYSAEADRAISRLQLKHRQAQGEVSGLWRELSGLRAAALESREGVDQDGARIIRIAESAYAGGELGVLELLDAYRSAYLAEIQTLELSAAARAAFIELDLLTGGAVE